MAYQKEAARIADKNNRCQHCGNPMEEYVVDMPESRIDPAVFSKTNLLHRFIVKEKLLEGNDGQDFC
jgi:uncharacterized protein with PIN domain